MILGGDFPVNLQKYIAALEKLGNDEVAIHKELVKEFSKNPDKLKVLKEHIRNHAAARKSFIKELKNAFKDK